MRRFFVKKNLGIPSRAFYSSWNSNVDPETLSGANPFTGSNLVGGKWTTTKAYQTVVDPMNGEPFIKVSNCYKKKCMHFLLICDFCSNPKRLPMNFSLFWTLLIVFQSLVSTIPLRIWSVICCMEMFPQRQPKP